MKKRIPSQAIQTGMYIEELDRPWIETPFLFQGFVVSTDEELEQLRKHCEYVYIDISKGTDIDENLLGAWHIHVTSSEAEELEDEKDLSERLDREMKEKVERAGKQPPAYKDKTSLEVEMAPAREAEQETRDVIYEIMEDVRLGKSIDTQGAKMAVEHMVHSIIRNPDALVCLSQLKEKDEYTALHSLRVSILALAFGRHLGLSEGHLNLLGLGALLHDIGKMKVPNEIINKPGRLTEEEFALMRSHVPEGVKILEATSDIPSAAIDVARYHHERWDGTGYARGLPGENISHFGLIGGIVDCYDAITSDRAYHLGMSSHDALKKMYEWRHKDFDSALVEQFIQCMGIFPIGSLVEMNTGSIAVVATINRQRRLKPRVVMVLTADKKPMIPPKVVDLYEQPTDSSGHTLEIRKVLPAGTHGINPSEFLPIREPFSMA